MTRKEAMRINQLEETLLNNGFMREEVEQLRRLSKRMSSWSERLCNDTEVDDDGKAYRYNSYTGKRYPCANMGRNLEKRLEVLMLFHRRRFIAYQQGDPRGVALYLIPRKVLRKRGIKENQIESYYNSIGIAIY